MIALLGKNYKMADASWTSVVSEHDAIMERLGNIETALAALQERECERNLRMEQYMREILSHVRQQAIVNQYSLPFSRAGETEFEQARAANLCLRQRVPFPLAKARSEGSRDP